jgi:hypothetical protein
VNNDGRLSRNYLKGKIGDMQNVIVYASGHNLRKILSKLAQDAKDFLMQIYLAWLFGCERVKRPKIIFG